MTVLGIGGVWHIASVGGWVLWVGNRSLQPSSKPVDKARFSRSRPWGRARAAF